MTTIRVPVVGAEEDDGTHACERVVVEHTRVLYFASCCDETWRRS